jgi:hypothetical protein
VGKLNDQFAEFDDMAEEANVKIPTFALRVLWGIDSDGDFTLCSSHVGSIEGITLIGLLETLKSRLLEA